MPAPQPAGPPAHPPARPPIRKVAAIAVPGVSPFELGITWEGFGIDRSDDGVPPFEYIVAAPGKRVRSAAGWTMTTDHDLDAVADADLVVVAPSEGRTGDFADRHFGAVFEVLRAAVDRGAEVMSLCSGAFLLGEAGLLDGRRCTTHWRFAEELAARYPAARVDPDVLFVCDGPILTSAGTAAGMDLCLHVVRREHGEEIARRVARRMVMPPHRDGGQAQYIDAPIRVRPADTLAPLMDELLDELADEHTVQTLAARVAMSQRTFARRFHAETGTTPHVWLTRQRVLLARRMLEAGDDPVDVVAERSGFGTAAMLRHHFTRVVGTSPSAYRRTFCASTGSPR